MRLFVQLSYDGSPFCGWQFQPNVPSVQQEVERALSIAFGEPVTVVGAGRTDTGVNARHYIAHFDVTAWPLEESARILRKINAILPPAIVAEAFYRVADEAHARFDAVSRSSLSHPILDEVLLRKAQIRIRQGRHVEADNLLQRLVDFYPDEITADDALMLRAEINENQLKNIDAAIECYEKLLIEYPTSLYTDQARKRYNQLKNE